MTKRQWSLVVVMILLNYIIFSQLFNRMMNTYSAVVVATPTTGPTFTPAPTSTPVVFPPTPTVTLEPTITNTPVVLTDDQKQATSVALTAEAAPPPTPTPEDRRPKVAPSQGTVNLRSGPGTNYPKVGALPVGKSLEITGRNNDSTWWQVSTTGGLAWIAASVTTASNVDNSIPVVQASPPPQPPTATPAPQPTAPPQPEHQYTINNIFGQVNEAITQIRGNIVDAGGAPVNGLRVRVRSGSFCTVSYPSGTPGVYPPGNYDILLDNHAKPGTWQVAIVNGPSNPNDTHCNDGLAVLSEEVSVSTDQKEGVVFIEWKKNY